MVDVDAQVQQKIDSVNAIITTALESAPTFMATLENIEATMPPYFIPNPQGLSLDPIVIDAVHPEAPDIDSIISELKAGEVEPFSAKDITDPKDYISAELLAMLPTIPDAPAEAEYSSGLLDALKEQLVNDVAGGVSGLSAEVEQAMWDRQSERDSQAFADAKDRMMSSWASTGFTLPDNVLNAMVADLVKKETDQRLDRSREITTDSFKMAVENRKFAITQGIVLESALMQHFNNVADRALKFLIARVDMSIKLFLAVIDGYKANAEAQLADVRLQVETERGRIDVYLAQLTTSKTQAEIASLKLDALTKKYGVDIQAYAAEIGKGEAFARITVEQQRMVAQNYLATFEASLQMAQQNLQTFMQGVGIRTQAATAGGNIYANYIASAINSLNAVMNMSSAHNETQDITGMQ